MNEYQTKKTFATTPGNNILESLGIGTGKESDMVDGLYYTGVGCSL